jgi:hypothetical protein
MNLDSTTSAATNRRQFGRTIAGAAVAAWAAPAVVCGRNLNEKLNIACIGVGGRGGSNLHDVSSENVVALCDVYQTAVDRAAQDHPKARRLTDFRRLYDHAKEFDAVVVSTTEHTHAFATLPALILGKHVYCEKPLTHDVWEARVIREAAARARVATQMGTQIHASDNYRRVVELVQAGTIGEVSEAHVWVGRAWGWQSDEAATRNGDIVSVRDRPAETQPVPKGLDWDLWIGPAPDRPFNEVYFPGPKWYRWWDFGNGTMSDLGSHWIDLPFWALKLQAPKTIEAFGPPPHPEIAPASMRVVYEYEAMGSQPKVRVTWYQGEEKPDPWRSGAIPRWDSGVLFVGSKGMLLSDYGKHRLLPEDAFRDVKRPEPTIPKSIGHHAEWIYACKTGSPATCHFDYAGRLTEANHLGNVAYRVGQKLEWDAEGLRATNAPEAELLLRRPYRKGWKLT